MVGTFAITGSAPAGSTAVDEARSRAAAAGAEYTEARERLEALRAEIDRVAAELGRTEAEFAEVSSAMAELAVDRYVESGNDLELFYAQDVNEQQKAAAFSRLVNQSRTDEADRYRALRDDLQRQRDNLRSLRSEAEELTEAAANRQTELEDELAIVEEASRERQAEAARQREAEQAAAAASANAAAVAADTRSGAGSDGASAPAADEGGSGGSDGSGGAGGSGGGAPWLRGGSWLCPIGGATVFSDTWGDACSSGRSHKGVDMWAEYGTPIVAVVSGSVEENSGGAGGLGQYLTGDDGASYYYAHLAWVEGSGRVSAGQVIGAVGDTGNALGGPAHLHFEIHPGGWGTAINPYSTVIAAC